ncbi:MAG: QueT transporter family protein [Agathobacter sp.]
MRNKKVLFVTQAAVIAAIYVVLTMFIAAFNLASGNIQVRISEALCILPFFTPAAIPGLWIGCLLANLLTGASIFDIVFGSLATLIGAVGTYLLRKHKFLCTLPPVISNMVIIPVVLRYAYQLTFIYNGIDFSIPFFALTVGIGEVISICVLGSILLNVLNKYKDVLWKQ